MPATTPLFGIRKLSVVMARLLVNNKDQGLRWFIVPICDEQAMYDGVISFRLPPRSGTAPLDFSITAFREVKLGHDALLGADLNLPSHLTRREAWWQEVWRIPLGSMAVGGPFIQAMKHTAYIGGKYSLHRMVMGRGHVPKPIISFPTQQWPIIHAVAVSLIMELWFKTMTNMVTDKNLDPRVRHALAIVVKTTVCRHFQYCVHAVAERCGARGTFATNFMAQFMVRLTTLFTPIPDMHIYDMVADDTQML